MMEPYKFYGITFQIHPVYRTFSANMSEPGINTAALQKFVRLQTRGITGFRQYQSLSWPMIGDPQ